jgi:integrase/recombinase XerD
VRYLPLHPGTAELVTDYLEAAGHGEDLGGALFRPVKNNTGGTIEGAVTADGIYKMVKYYAKRVGMNIEGFGAHSLRATAATNAARPRDRHRQGPGVARACHHTTL